MSWNAHPNRSGCGQISLAAIMILSISVTIYLGFLIRKQDNFENNTQGWEEFTTLPYAVPVWSDIVYRYPPLRNLTELGTVDGKNLQYQNIKKSKPTVALGVVACGSRVEGAITMLKSAVIFSQHVNLHIVGVSDKKKHLHFARLVDQLRIQSKLSLDVDVSYEIYPTWFPNENPELWRNMFRPCSTQRLFFSSMFPHIDSLLYLDTDALFLANILDVWSYFDDMNSKQFVGMVQEDELNGWYIMKSKSLYYEPRGLNSGVMLMNLTRMRAFSFQERVIQTCNSYNVLRFGDQDILNILFHFEPDYVLELNCSYNFRAQHCKCFYDLPGDCSCHAMKETGVSILHGNRELFRKFNHTTTVFLRDFYKSFKKYDLTQSSKSNLKQFYNQLKKQYNKRPSCQGATSLDILRKFKLYLSTLPTT